MIGSTNSTNYKDSDNVLNGVEYCYKIVAYRDFGLDMVPAPAGDGFSGVMRDSRR